MNPAMPGYVPRTCRVGVTSAKGMVVSAHPLASLAGLRVLMDGGNAVDATVAMAAALNVVEPYMSGALGVGQMLIHTPHDSRVVALDFGGRSPAGANPDVFDGHASIPMDDLRSALVPANLAGWLAALETFGVMDRARVFRDAIDYGSNGFPLTEGNAAWMALHRTRLSRFATSRDVFVDSLNPRPGLIFTQPDLANTYRQFAAEGARALYDGSIGHEVVRFCQENGGLIGRDDLRRYEPRLAAPIGINFRNHRVLTMPPPSMGVQILLTLNIVEGFELRSLGHNSAKYLHTLAEAIKLASVDRAEFTAQPEPPVSGLLQKSYAAERRKLIDSRRAAHSPGERWSRTADLLAGRPNDPGLTTFLCAADRDGTTVALTQSLGNAFGCGAVAGSTGLLLNDFAWWFDLDADSPNRIAPSKPVEQCLSPCLVFGEDGLVLAIGTPGGHGIPQTTAQLLLNMLDFGMNVQEAIEAPRIRLFADTSMDVEERIPAEVRDDLAARGHHVSLLPAYHWGVGGGHGITRFPDSGAFMGGADPRREGYALGW